MYNRVIFMGRLTRDPELRTTPSGVTMCRFSIAVDRARSSGQEKQTDFFDVVCWRKTAEFVSKYFHKGQMIHVEGTMQNNNYTDQNGAKHYGMSVNADAVAFCGDKAQQNTQQNPQYNPQNTNQGGWQSPPPQEPDYNPYF